MIAIEQVRRDPDTVRRAMESRGMNPIQIDEILELDAAWRRDRTAGRRNAQPAQPSEPRYRTRPFGWSASRARGNRGDAFLRADSVNELEASAQERRSSRIHQMLLGHAQSSALRGCPRRQLTPKTIPYTSALKANPTELGFEGSAPLGVGRAAGNHRLPDAVRQALGQPLLHHHRVPEPGWSALSSPGCWTCIHSEHGYTELALPAMVRRDVMEGSGNLPKFADNLYHDEEDDLWLIPTAEVPITNLYRDEIIPPGRLPLLLRGTDPLLSAVKRRLRGETRGASSECISSTRSRCTSS